MRRVLLAAGAISAAIMSPAFATEPFVGRWAVSADACRGQGETASTSPLVATDTSLSWFEGFCRIGKMYKAKAVFLQLHCGAKDVSVTLDAQGDQMRVTWDRKTENMKRCK
jgi:hypothetical protein